MVMREIKFRGKRLDNGEWWYGSLVIINSRYFIFSDEGRYEVSGATVGQYTGLTDKNGNAIYEGDVMEIPETDFNAYIVGTVEYQEDSFFIQSRNGGSLWGLQWSLRKHNAGILGNIHDNPELLKAKIWGTFMITQNN